MFAAFSFGLLHSTDFLAGIFAIPLIFKVYRREYKKRFGWIRAGKIEQEEFYAWSEKAREEKPCAMPGRSACRSLLSG